MKYKVIFIFYVSKCKLSVFMSSTTSFYDYIFLIKQQIWFSAILLVWTIKIKNLNMKVTYYRPITQKLFEKKFQISYTLLYPTQMLYYRLSAKYLGFSTVQYPLHSSMNGLLTMLTSTPLCPHKINTNAAPRQVIRCRWCVHDSSRDTSDYTSITCEMADETRSDWIILC